MLLSLSDRKDRSSSQSFSSSFDVRDVLQNRLRTQDRDLAIKIRNTSTTFSTFFNQKSVTSYFDSRISLNFDFYSKSETSTSKFRKLSDKQLSESSESLHFSEEKENVFFFVLSSLSFNTDRHRRRIKISILKNTENIRRNRLITSITMINFTISEF